MKIQLPPARFVDQFEYQLRPYSEEKIKVGHIATRVVFPRIHGKRGAERHVEFKPVVFPEAAAYRPPVIFAAHAPEVATIDQVRKRDSTNRSLIGRRIVGQHTRKAAHTDFP